MTKSLRICILSCNELVSSESAAATASYGVSGSDEQFLYDALTRRGIPFEICVWNDLKIEEYSCVLVRTVWDYFASATVLESFTKLLHRLLELGVPTYNHPRVILWNIHKKYLHHLATLGVPVIETVYIAKGEAADLKKIVGSHGWSGLIIKPCVGGGSRGSFRLETISASGLAEAQQFLDRALGHSSRLPSSSPCQACGVAIQWTEGETSEKPCSCWPRDVMLQPFVSSVCTDGELSVMVIDGRISHAVQKRAKSGDYRTQQEHGGVVSSAVLDAAAEAAVYRAVSTARQAIESWDDGPARGPLPSDAMLCARVDFLRKDAQWLLLEFEAIDPSFFFGLSACGDEVGADTSTSDTAGAGPACGPLVELPAAAEAFADALAKRLSALPGTATISITV